MNSPDLKDIYLATDIEEPMATKVALDFREIVARLEALNLPEVDVVVGIASGGVVPASLLAYKLRSPLVLFSINYRAEDNRPQRDAPELLQPVTLPPKPSRILLVDDVSVTGRTLELAKRLLEGYEVTTLVFKGQADHVVFPEVRECVAWPWKGWP